MGILCRNVCPTRNIPVGNNRLLLPTWLKADIIRLLSCARLVAVKLRRSGVRLAIPVMASEQKRAGVCEHTTVSYTHLRAHETEADL
eukprot:2715309-Amphidinium_carterae.1